MDNVAEEQKKEIGEQLWGWYHATDGEKIADAIKRITGVSSPKPLEPEK